MLKRLMWMISIIGVSGCSSLDCCHWWGRNTDGSSNLAHNKPDPVQQSPIGGTYNRPASTASPLQQPVQPAATPLVTASPVQTFNAPPSDSSNPLLTPPSPPANVMAPPQNAVPGAIPTSLQTEDKTKLGNGSMLPNTPMPPATANALPENNPSIPQPMVPAPLVTGPATTSERSSAPMVLGLPANTTANTAPGMPEPPTIAMPVIASPEVTKPLDIAPPKVGTPGKTATLNPGTVPPPLSPPPAIPVLDSKYR
jgi:hypothetical protein